MRVTSILRYLPVLRYVPVACLVLLAACTGPAGDGSAFVVVFNPTSVALDTEAQSVIATAGKAARADTDRSVTVAGYAAPPTSEVPASDFLISRSRSQIVANALVAQGIKQSRIVLAPRSGAGGNTAYEARRVEVVLGR